MWILCNITFLVAYFGFGWPMKEKKFLIVVSLSRHSKLLIERVKEEIESVQEQNAVVSMRILFFLERSELKKISRSISDQGFLGENLRKGVIQSLVQEQQRLADQYIHNLVQLAESHKVPVEVHKEEGDFVKRILHHVQEQSFDLIFLTKDDRPFISRFLFGSQIDRAVQRISKEGATPILVKGDTGWN